MLCPFVCHPVIVHHSFDDLDCCFHHHHHVACVSFDDIDAQIKKDMERMRKEMDKSIERMDEIMKQARERAQSSLNDSSSRSSRKALTNGDSNTRRNGSGGSGGSSSYVYERSSSSERRYTTNNAASSSYNNNNNNNYNSSSSSSALANTNVCPELDIPKLGDHDALLKTHEQELETLPKVKGSQMTIDFNLPKNVDPKKLKVSCNDNEVIVEAEDKFNDASSKTEYSYYKKTSLPPNTDVNAMKCFLENNTHISITAPMLSGSSRSNQRQNIPIEYRRN